MNLKSGRGKVFLCLVLCVLSGCSAIRNLTREKKLPRMLVLPFACNCETPDLGDKMTLGFVEEIDKGMLQVFDAPEFELLLSSISRLNQESKMKRAAQDLPPADSQDSKEETPSTTPNASNSAQEEKVEPIFAFSTATFFRDVSLNEFFRTKVRLETGLAYIVKGSAKEQKLSALEVGNLQTAETAEVKMIELEKGTVLFSDNFKQGSFEVVAPDRIGSKFAAKINKKLKAMRKQEKKIQKELDRKMPERY